MSQKVTLKNELNARQPYEMKSKQIPKGTEIIVEEWDHDLTDSRVLWNGVTYLVNRESLEVLGDHD